VDDLPEYAFVPGGPWPHPNRAAPGPVRKSVEPIPEQDWSASAEYVRGFSLFNGGYYWEAHEVWESLWHAHLRVGPTADVLKGLIKLAAAGVKVRERQRHGVVTHAGRAARLFEEAEHAGGRFQVGLDLTLLRTIASKVADDPPTDPGPPGARVSRVFEFELTPS
jgi:hypothetical protein